jgi:hypothetical protein
MIDSLTCMRGNITVTVQFKKNNNKIDKPFVFIS